MTLFMNISVAASLAVGSYALIGLVLRRLYINGATATLLVFLAFGATAGGEFVREGARKPYSIRHVLYSNSIRPADVQRLREVGCLADDPYPLRRTERYPDERIARGARVYRRLCSTCHTVRGVNALTELTGPWDLDQMRMNIAKLQQTKPFMPPFAGTAEELESLVRFIRWSGTGTSTEDEEASEAEVLIQIQKWLDAAGTQPGGHSSTGSPGSKK
jgi:mono/diheme cytochrome c family protein